MPLLHVDDRQVTFRIKDYRDGNRHKTLCLEGEAFVQRFLLHVLPKGLMRVRRYGFLANRGRREKLARIRRALATPPQEDPSASAETAVPRYRCPRCRRDLLQVVAMLAPQRPVRLPPG